MYHPMPPRIRETPHVLHMFLSVITVGMWAPFWLLIAVTNKHHNDRNQRRYAEDMMRYEIWKQELHRMQKDF